MCHDSALTTGAPIAYERHHSLATSQVPGRPALLAIWLSGTPPPLLRQQIQPAREGRDRAALRKAAAGNRQQWVESSRSGRRSTSTSARLRHGSTLAAALHAPLKGVQCMQLATSATQRNATRATNMKRNAIPPLPDALEMRRETHSYRKFTIRCP